MSIKLAKSNKGITLLESLIYLALFAVVFIGVIQFTFTISDSNESTEQIEKTEKASIFIMNHLNDSFNKAESVDAINSTFSDDNGVLRLTTAGGYFEYKIISGQLNFVDSGVTGDFITNPDFLMEKFNLEQVLDSKDVLVGVRVIIEFHKVLDSTVSKTIETSFIFK